MKIRNLAFAAIAAFALNQSADAQNIIGVGVPGGTTRNDTYVAAGVEFYAPVAGTTINALGYWDASGSGLQAPHTVTLFKYAGSGSSYNPVVGATIPAGTNAPLINGYRWVSIPATALPNNGQGGGYYVILAVHSQDTWANSIGSAPYMNPSIGTVSGQGLIGNGTSFTVFGDPIDIVGTGNPNQGFGGANLAYLTNSLPASASPAQITWVENGTFTDNTVLEKAGAVSNEVYGVNFGAGPQTTANGYTFDDFQTTGNATLGGTVNAATGYYLTTGGGSTGDAALDAVLDNGYFGDTGTYCLLNNLTVGQKYTVLALAADTSGIGGTAQFQETDDLTYSPPQTFTFTGGTPAIGGYSVGTFTAVATSQIFTMRSAGHYQYQAMLLAKYTPPIYPEIVVVTNPQPASLTKGVGGQVTYTAAFSNSPSVTVQWQFIANGVTNILSSGVVNTTNSGILVSTLTLTNLQGANAGSYIAKAVDATNSLNFKFTLAVTLNVQALISWVQSGTFSDNSVLGLAGSPASEVYGVDFGGSGSQTVNGYSFDDYLTSGNMDVANSPNSYDNYLNGIATTGDGGLDSMLTHGVYGGSENAGTLKNLTIGQTYSVLVLLADARGSAAGGSVFRSTDGIAVSSLQQYAFENGTPSVGGYMLGRFTAQATTQPLSVFNNYPFASQYNAILVAQTSAPTNPPIYLMSDISPTGATVGEGTNVTFTASFRSSSTLTIQWQSVIGGVTNAISTGVVTTNNGADVVSTLTLSSVQTSASGNRYQVKAINATNSANYTYSSLATLSVVPVITWTSSGTFTDNSVLALVGTPADVVYAVDFGGSGLQTTANGYTFDDGITTGNMTLTGHSDFGGYMSGETIAATTGDTSFDQVLAFGSYGGSGVVGTLHNLTPGQKYHILVLLADTRGVTAGGLVFVVRDGVHQGTNQIYAFANGVPAVGGYYLGSITTVSTNQTLEIATSLALDATFYLASQYNAVVVAKAAAVTPVPPVLAAPKYSGGNLILTGTGGTPGAGYTWLTSTNLMNPIATWTTNTTGVLDGSGSLSNAIPVNPDGMSQFFRLRLP